MIDIHHYVPPHEQLTSDLYWTFGDTVEAPEATRWQELRYSMTAFWAGTGAVREAFREVYEDEPNMRVRPLPAFEPLPEQNPTQPGIFQLLVDHRTQFLDTKAGRRAQELAREQSLPHEEFNHQFQDIAQNPLYTGFDIHTYVEAADMAISRTVLYARSVPNRTWRYVALSGRALHNETDPAVRPSSVTPVLLGQEMVRRVVVAHNPRQGTLSHNQISSAKLLTPNAVPGGRRRRALRDAADLLWQPAFGASPA